MITIKETTDLSSTVYKDALTLRKDVFVKEQHVPLELEIEQEDVTIHFVLYEENTPQATVRLLPKSSTLYKVQRMAVAQSGRKKGLGRELMTYAEAYVKKQGGNELLLGAQTQAVPFYQSLGYQVFGDEYLDAGITHLDMKKSV